MAVEAGGRWSHYTLLRKLGAGGSGEVWRARDERLGRDVALKLLRDDLAGHPDRIERFATEARTLASLHHPNIVVIHAVEEAQGRPFLAMELVEGPTLTDSIPVAGLPWDRLVELALPVARAVGCAHAKGIVHGDLKPGNVVLHPDGRPVVLDFGLARVARTAQAASPDEVSTRTSGDGEALTGTVPYMSPEGARARPADARSDVFSLGTLLYEMAAGRRPFAGGTAAETLAAILRDVPRPLEAVRPDLPMAFCRIVARCLEKEPARRFATAGEVADALEDVVARGPSAFEDETPSIAVLPFADMSEAHDQDYLCEGLADEIIHALCCVRRLRVASRTAAFRFRGADLDPRQIGERLGVTFLLEGSVRKAGDRVRITARLVAAQDGLQAWSESYDRRLEDVFAIQDEIAQEVVAALEVSLSPRERRALRNVSTRDVLAYEYYLRGRRFYYRYGRRAIEFAVDLFSKAIERDPCYALAWAGIADCRSYLYLNAGRGESDRVEADAASRRALELDPDLAEAHAARAVAVSLFDRHEEADREFRAATAANPRLFEAWYFHARECFARGRLEEAAELYETAADVRPDDYQSLLLVGQIYDDLGRPDAARSARERGVARAKAVLELNPDDSRALYMAANGLAMLGESDRAVEWAERALRIEPDEAMILYNVACVLSLCGRKDRALDLLERAVATGLAHWDWIEHDSNLDPLREEPRFRVLTAARTPA